MSKSLERAAEVAKAIATLNKMGVKPGATIYTLVKSVSKSGMSRQIQCYIATRDTTTRNGKTFRENAIHDITGLVSTATGIKRGRDGWSLNVGGCGMDICFHVVYTLGRVMFPKGGPLECSPREHQEKRAGKKIETDGGYLLNKRDL
jgi:hypothetical protein